MNGSVRGPFLPVWETERNWIQIFSDMITNKVKLVGTTINCNPAWNNVHKLHIQSERALFSFVVGLCCTHSSSSSGMLLVTDEIGLRILKPFIKCKMQYVDAIIHGEIAASQVCLVRCVRRHVDRVKTRHS